jgi:hypothetical protein
LAFAHVDLHGSSKVSAPSMTAKRIRKPPRQSSKGAEAIRRAIAKSDPTKEPPTVGKPVIIDPVAPAEPHSAGGRPRQRRKNEDAKH